LVVWIFYKVGFNFEIITVFFTILIIAALCIFGKQRHLGQIPLAVVILVLILPIFRSAKIYPMNKKFVSSIMIAPILFSGVYATGIAVTYDWKFPFSTTFGDTFQSSSNSVTVLYDGGRPTYLPALVNNPAANVYQLMGNTNRHFFLFDNSSWQFSKKLAFSDLCMSNKYQNIYLYSKIATNPNIHQFLVNDSGEFGNSGIESSESEIQLRLFKTDQGKSMFCTPKYFETILSSIYEQVPAYSE